MDIKSYIKENFFLPLFVHGKPNKSRKELRNVFAYKGEFSTNERNNFYDEAYGEILFDLFIQWVQSPVDEADTREHLYRQALALGSVKEKMINYEMFGKNLAFLDTEPENEDEEDNATG